MLTQLVCHVRPSRRKAIDAAAMEMLCLLRDLGPNRLPGGPLSDKGGIFWIEIADTLLDRAENLFTRIGYTRAIDRLDLVAHIRRNSRGTIRWRRRFYKVVRIYEENSRLIRDQSPDRREFVILDHKGQPKTVNGYRGDGTPLGRRGLPVCDARLLVNISRAPEPAQDRFLDPFVGTGGIALEALAAGYSVFTCDIDPAVSLGLRQLGFHHHVADARYLPFPGAAFGAVAGEPPYHEEFGSRVVKALWELDRVLSPGGTLVLYCSEHQAEPLKSEGKALGLSLIFESPVNRKGTACVILAWKKRHD